MAAPKGNNYAVGNPGGGRPTKYKPEFVTIAQKMCELGATDREVADALSISVPTFYEWKAQHEDFSLALKTGKEIADERVERSLYQRAVGYEEDAVKIFMPANAKKPVYAPYREKIVPDTTAQIFWLKNRRSKAWRDRQENVNVNVTIAGEFESLMRQINKGEPLTLELNSNESQEIPSGDFSSDQK